MLDIKNEYNLKIDELRKLLKSAKNFDRAIDLALNIHAITHCAIVSASANPSYYDELIAGLNNEDYCVMPTEKDETIAWHIWHITRIEDLVGNLLIAEQPQVFNDQWMKKLNVTIKDTGNAMSDQEIISFSKAVNIQELQNYRIAVGQQTRKILHALDVDDLKRKPREEYLDRIVSEGGLLPSKDSIWLRDFWAKHTVAGLILLPIIRHHMMHLPDSYRISSSRKA